MRLRSCTRLFTLAVSCAFAHHASAAFVILDDFNVNEGHFTSAPNASGSTNGINVTTSTIDRITTDSYEGAGSQQLVLIDDATTAGGTARLRHLSGGGAAASNTVIPVTAGVDGWIGFLLKTTTPGWNVQMWLEGVENNGSAQKTVIADGKWHVYEWNLDDQTGGPDGWQAAGVPGIIGGDIDVENGNYTIDSVLFRHTAMPATSTILIDFVAYNPLGHVPEPASLAMAGLGMIGLLAARRKLV